ncbi:ATP-dependent DNA helicase RecG [Conexibacter sp. CPCC 206217]|uniref:ATP-dependent DNA helicase RecG n=1 Tax=Conexibacter sp. CPCC 206217 TaxID=3064574 RepID=UPI00271A7DC5|nr:ATP-dependent DNA helicase RecG [Conexibacter sp. CPCC 206217]MDO8212776.1 ATP-dependent DNA helicase RecG [Conexibacter sp. CPCC 206217]
MPSTPPFQFASTEPLDDDQLRAAPLRLPRPSRLREELDAPGPRAARALETLRVQTVGQLLGHLPRARGEARTIADLVEEETSTILVEVRSISSRPVRRRGMRPLVEATVVDQTSSLKVTFFNQPWLVERYRPGTRLMLTGRLGQRSFKVSGHAPTTQQVAGVEQVAQYPASEGISSVQLLALAQEHRDAIADTIEPLPARVRLADELPDRHAALTAVHFPSRERDPVDGRRRLAYDELLLLQLGLLRRRARREQSTRAPQLDGPRELSARWLESGLPFRPTGDQQRAMAAVDADLARDRAMQRLLMGEVGSGKTVVALFALLRAVEQGWQGALMAPTETLAEQHFATIQGLMGADALQIGLLTGSTPGGRRRDLLGKLASGELALIVGTHALIEDAVAFARLGVVVVDEQHRFGVRQRAALDRKAPPGLTPHVLHMTATPIPRTLALVEHGDLDHTALRELPRGRQPIETHVASGEKARERAYERIREELRAGRQAFVVCPLVGESEALQARAATEEFERLRRTEFKDFRVVLMHGQMRPREKQEAMRAFAAGGADVLVATSVIEVGIDVPNATVMLVEDAERYGISQLHQLRGRIGRGEHKSLCLLFGPTDSARLRALAAHGDGFELARIDLVLRREGDIVGVRQHGEVAYRIAILPDDEDLLERAHFRAEQLLQADPELDAPEHALLKDALAEVFGPDAMAPIAA